MPDCRQAIPELPPSAQSQIPSNAPKPSRQLSYTTCRPIAARRGTGGAIAIPPANERPGCRPDTNIWKKLLSRWLRAVGSRPVTAQHTSPRSCPSFSRPLSHHARAHGPPTPKDTLAHFKKTAKYKTAQPYLRVLLHTPAHPSRSPQPNTRAASRSKVTEKPHNMHASTSAPPVV